MKNTNLVFGGILLAMVVLFSGLFIWYGSTEVAFELRDDGVYRKIKNGRLGANCYNESGERVIAPSRFFGLEWTLIEAEPQSGETFSILCKPYRGNLASRVGLNLTVPGVPN